MIDINRLRKLRELVRRGIGGESRNAEEILTRLLEKEGMTLDQFLSEDTEEVSSYKFRFWDRWDKQLLFQIYSMIKDTNKISYSKYKRTKELIFELTKSQYIEFSYLYEIYRKALSKEFDRETSAFIIKNNIFSNSNKSDREPTPEEMKELDKIYSKLSGTDFVQVRKAIENK